MGEHDRSGAYGLESPTAHRDYYDAWAATYDEDFLLTTGYRVPAEVARVLVERAGDGPNGGPLAGAVADLGCGTGALGAAVARACPGTLIDGFDISPGMLERARATGAYRHLHCVDLTVVVPTERYRAVVSSGTFTVGHLGPQGLTVVSALLAPGGLAVLGVNAHHFAAAGFAEALAELSDSGAITDLHTEIVASYPTANGEPQDTTRIVAFRAP